VRLENRGNKVIHMEKGDCLFQLVPSVSFLGGMYEVLSFRKGVPIEFPSSPSSPPPTPPTESPQPQPPLQIPLEPVAADQEVVVDPEAETEDEEEEDEHDRHAQDLREKSQAEDYLATQQFLQESQEEEAIEAGLATVVNDDNSNDNSAEPYMAFKKSRWDLKPTIPNPWPPTAVKEGGKEAAEERVVVVVAEGPTE
jgi:hypothetical protein